MSKDMLINAQRDEIRIAIVADGFINELYTERASNLVAVGNIYKGKVTNVEPSIQAAFVDYGKVKNGFLHISDVHPQFFPSGQKQTEAVGKKRSRRDRPPIQACLRRGMEVIVQVTKEGVGTKGATLTTYISIPGRYLVLMPGMARLGVSRKIDNEEERNRMRQILEELKPPEDLGFIVRTAGLSRPKRELQRDLNYLTRLWLSVIKKSKQAKAPAELYQESDLVIRTIRDVYNTEIERIICDNETVAMKIKEFFKLTMPRSNHKVEFYTGQIGLFHGFGLEQELENINSARVPLPSGGSIVIEQTEAMVTIDVNSGRLRETDSAEHTALRTNSEAAHEALRQLRLRDMGGVIAIDFIDMTEERHRRQIENLVRDELKTDRARTKVLRISRFGLLEMTRQRVRPSLQTSTFQSCPACGGAGRIKSQESQALTAMRMLNLACSDERIETLELLVHSSVADHILNERRDEIIQLEQSSQKRIHVHGSADIQPGGYKIVCKDARGSDVQWDPTALQAKAHKEVPTREITAEDVADYRRKQGLSGEMPLEMQDLLEPEEGGEDMDFPIGEPIEPVEDDERQQQMQETAEEFENAPEPMEAAEHVTAVVAQQPAGIPQGPPVEGEVGPGGRKRRRRRRGGRRHRRKNKGLVAADGQQPEGAATPQEPAQAGAAPTHEPMPERPVPAQPAEPREQPQRREQQRREPQPQRQGGRREQPPRHRPAPRPQAQPSPQAEPQSQPVHEAPTAEQQPPAPPREAAAPQQPKPAERVEAAAPPPAPQAAPIEPAVPEAAPAAEGEKPAKPKRRRVYRPRTRKPKAAKPAEDTPPSEDPA